MEIDQLALDLPTDDSLTELVEGWSRTVRAVKTSGAIHERRASSEAKLREVLPDAFAEGDHWHILSAGDVDAMSFAAHLLRTRSASYMLFSTWHMAADDIERLNLWLQTGTVARCDAYIGEIFRNSYPREYGALCSTIRPCGGRVCTFRNHSKVFCIAAGDERFTIESSANINTNPRCENTVLTKSATLYAHHKRYFDEVHAFNAADFPQWTPHP
jgi:hypothetical protein